MGGSKNKSPAQKEKSQKQKQDAGSKKPKKSEKGDTSTKTTLSVTIDESQATKYINETKVITVHDLARQTGVKISVANSFLQKSLKDGTVKKLGGFSGHYVYQSITGK